jgi:hypothetical protein
MSGGDAIPPMGGIELRGDTLVVDREPNQLDELAFAFSAQCDRLGIDHVFVAGYVAILAGRARATQDIDVLLEPSDTETIEDLAVRLAEGSYWGPAMPLSEMATVLEDGGTIWVARDGEMAPYLDVQFVSDRFDRASLDGAIRGRIGGRELPIGPLELQIASKLHLGTQTDNEDAAHIYTLFVESLSTERLEHWVDALEVDDAYERLQGEP